MALFVRAYGLLASLVIIEMTTSNSPWRICGVFFFSYQPNSNPLQHQGFDPEQLAKTRLTHRTHGGVSKNVICRGIKFFSIPVSTLTDAYC